MYTRDNKIGWMMLMSLNLVLGPCIYISGEVTTHLL